MMEREKFLSAGAARIGNMMTRHARRHGWLSENEKVTCTLSFTLEATGKGEIFPMRIKDYFTIARFEAAGINPKQLRKRILHACDTSYPNGQPFEIVTVGELFALGRKKFTKLGRDSIGKKCCDAIQKILEKDGVDGFW